MFHETLKGADEPRAQKSCCCLPQGGNFGLLRRFSIEL